MDLEYFPRDVGGVASAVVGLVIVVGLLFVWARRGEKWGMSSGSAGCEFTEKSESSFHA